MQKKQLKILDNMKITIDNDYNKDHEKINFMKNKNNKRKVIIHVEEKYKKDSQKMNKVFFIGDNILMIYKVK